MRICAVVLALFLSACTNDYGSLRFPHKTADETDGGVSSGDGVPSEDAGPDAH